MKYNTELATAVLGENGLAVEAGWLKIYSIEPEKREYLQASIEYLPVGVGLPALSYTDKPEQPAEGHALIRSEDGTRWESVPDFRGQAVYATADGKPQIFTVPGPLPDGLTLLAPATDYDEWDGEKWVTDKGALHQAEIESARQEFSRRQADASAAIFMLQDAVDLDMATEAEIALLEAWKKYRVLLSRLDLNSAPDILWPEKPGA